MRKIFNNFQPIIKHLISVFTFAGSIIGIVLHFYLKQLVVNPAATAGSISFFYQFSYVIYIIALLFVAWFISLEIRPSYLYKLFGSYFSYWIVSYFLTVSMNLNNGDFELWSLSKNGFFQINFLPTVIIVIILAIIFKFFRNRVYKKTKKLWQNSQDSHFTIYGLLAVAILTDDLSYAVISRLYSKYLIVGLTSFGTHLIIYIIGMGLLYALLTYFIIQGYRDLLKNKPTMSVTVGSSFLFALIFNYLLQYGVKKSEALMELFVFPAATTYQIVVIFLLSLLVYLLLNRYLLSTILIIAFWSVIGTINIIKMDMRNEPMLFTDFAWIKQIGLITEFVNLTIVLGIVAVLFAFILIFIFLRKKVLPGQIFTNWKLRAILLLGILTLFGGMYSIFRREENRIIQNGIPVISQLNNNYNIFWLDLSYHARYRSLLFVWIQQITAEAVEKPDDYSEERMKELAEKYTALAQSINKERDEELGEQTVIFILSESYSDPTKLEGVTISQDIMPNIRSIMQSNTSGVMWSDDYGGGTANMEWQSLVGLPMYNMSESISTINTEVVPNMSEIPSISDLFESENRIAIHLGDAMTYSRNTLYEDKLNFSEFIAGKNGTKTADFYQLGLFPSDDSTYSTILDSIDESENQFFSVISYQNHIPYSQGEPENLTAEGELLSDEENESLTSYARLMYYTDVETQKFLEKLSALDQKVTVVFYGDHLPGFYPSAQFTNNPDSQYETEYFIWSNYQTEKYDYSFVNSSDFPAAVLAHTNSKVSPYYALLTEVLEKATVGKDLSTEERIIAEDLILVEYDLISGNGYLNNIEGFFDVVD